MQKKLWTNCSRTNHYIQFCCITLGVDPRLIDLAPDNQTVIAICYLDHLTEGHTILGYYTRYSTLLGYMDTMAA